MAKIEDIITITIKTYTEIPPFTVTGWGGSDWNFLSGTVSTEDKPRLRTITKCKKLATKALNIKGKTFPEYIQHRLVKDNLGFVPADNFSDGQTDCRSYIKAVAPQNPVEFLVYAHELGHCKSKQYVDNVLSGFTMKVGKMTVRNELNAWLWALRYYRRLGFQLCKEGKAEIVKAFSSYLNLAEKSVAFEAAKVLNDAYGVGIKINSYATAKPKEVMMVEKPQSWKPWHDLKQKQMKRSWKHCK